MNKHLKGLIEEKESLLSRLSEVNDSILKEHDNMTFDEWYKHGIKKHYPYIIRNFPLLRKIIDDRDLRKFEIFNLEDFEDELKFNEEDYKKSLENNDYDYYEETLIESVEDLELLKKELKEANFGSMVNDW